MELTKKTLARAQPIEATKLARCVALFQRVLLCAGCPVAPWSTGGTVIICGGIFRRIDEIS